MLTNEQIQAQYDLLVSNLKAGIQSPELRDRTLAFVATHKPSLLLAPASSAHSKHHAFPGGLLQHINENISQGSIFLQQILNFAGLVGSQAMEDLVMVALLHDLHKIGDPYGRAYYELNMIKASRKQGDTSMKQSTAKPYAVNGCAFKVGNVPEALSYSSHLKAVAVFLDRNVDKVPQGELSLYLINAIDPALYAALNAEVIFSIRYHDGAYQSGAKFELAGKETPVMLAHHFADMVSSRKPKWLNAATEVSED